MGLCKWLLIFAALPAFAAPTAVLWSSPAQPYWAAHGNPQAGASFDSSGVHTNTLYASGSINAVTCSITNVSGPNTPTITSPTSCTSTTVTGIIASTPAANYVFQLTVTDSMGAMNTTTLQVGAVPIDANCNLAPTDPKVSGAFGPLVAFGCNPWHYEDSQNYSAIHQSTTWWPANYSLNWTVLNTSGTISWPFYATGINVGAACTTLTAAITSTTQTSISVANAGCLKGITSLPTWILVNNTGFGDIAPEMMRITACTDTATTMPCTGTTMAATMTVGYDGRGMSGNLVGIGGYPNTVAAKTWLNGSAVGEMLIKGSGTKFGTDATQAICQAGLPGPPGVVTYQVGTVDLASNIGTTTISGSGTTWNNANGVFVGGHIRVVATHSSGTAQPFWAQIVTITNATHLVLDHPIPAGEDVGNFSYAITSPAMYLALQFNGTNGDTPEIIQNGVGCESETSMFALPIHDFTSFDTVYQNGSLKYSFKTDIGNVAHGGTSAYAYYGVGPASRMFWERSGLTEALTLANYIDENICRDPELADGFVQPAVLTIGGAVIGCMIDKILNASTVLTWPNLEEYGRTSMSVLVPGGVLSPCNATDTREGAYREAWTTIASENDPQASDPMQDFVTGARNMLKRDLGTMTFPGCLRNASDGYVGAEVNSFSNSFVFNPQGPSSTQWTQPLTLTNLSTAVTGSGFNNGLAGTYPNYSGSTPGYCWGQDIVMLTVNTGQSTATVASGTLNPASLIYFYDGSKVGMFEFTVAGTAVQLSGVWLGASGTFSAMSTGGGPINSGGQVVGGFMGIVAQVSPTSPPIDNLANNQALEKVWACKFNSSSSLTLFRAWDGISTSALTGGNQYYGSYYNVGTFGQQPFMFGIKALQISAAAKSADSVTAAAAQAIWPLMGQSFNANGWDANNANHGTAYNIVFQPCGSQADVPAGSFDSIHAFEGCAPFGSTSNAKQEARVDSMEGGAAMLAFYLANPTPTNKAIVDTFYGAIVGLSGTCDSSISSTCDGTTAFHLADSDFTVPRWVGFDFGMGGFFMNTWPAVRNMTLPQLCSAYPKSGACQSFPGKTEMGPRSTSGNRASGGIQ